MTGHPNMGYAAVTDPTRLGHAVRFDFTRLDNTPSKSGVVPTRTTRAAPVRRIPFDAKPYRGPIRE